MKTAIYKRIAPVFIILGLLLAGGCEENFIGRQFDTDEEYMQIYDYVKTRPDLSIYKEVCDYSGFYSQISTAGSYTIFAPVDSAWQKLFKKQNITSYKEKSPEYWLAFMKYSALESRINTNSFDGGKMSAFTMLDKNYYLSVDITVYTAMKLNNSAVIKEYNIELKNGYLNLTDAVLMPPITPIYDLLKEDGRYTVMLSLFEDNGLKSYLTDSLITLFVEPDILFEDNELDPRKSMSADELKDWLKYHIFPGTRYFINDVDKKMLQPLYEKDVVTFNVKTLTGDGKGSVFLNQQARVSTRADQNARNGIFHEMFDMIRIQDHTLGTINTNLYGGSNSKKGYVQNVFTDAPAIIRENMLYNSYHQMSLNQPQPPICQFSSGQSGDSFIVKIPDVVKGSYTVRMIYNNLTSPTLRLIFKDKVIKSGIKMGEKDGDFTEYVTLKYKDCGSIEVSERGDIELKFVVDEYSALLMDRIDLIPAISF